MPSGKEGVCDMRGEVWVGRHAGVYAAAAAEAAQEAARKSRGAGPSEGWGFKWQVQRSTPRTC